MNETYIQAIGFVALAVNLMGTSTVNDNKMRMLIFGSCFLFAIHYTLLGAVVAGANLFINSIRALVSIKYKTKTMFWSFLIGQTIISAYFYTGTEDLIPWFASAINCYALFLCKGIRMRAAFLTGTMLWFVNAAVVGSYGGMINDAFNSTMLLLTIYRLNRSSKPQTA
ncbi:YgjV family protein [Vibrio sp.]|nr:YgjV family protein [Vibrio sp.]